ncbi:uncharacterized protein LOC106651461 [Trichogramma pretiosum]|uniref:uncharacterized protein LOC106651461 n=1 Tax=Trichogramma pretiosum TaxID=7493 RepID=UPI0006C98DE4|nr:uncharacterized protein LOC106651461 [Trichogramma pretiosum]
MSQKRTLMNRGYFLKKPHADVIINLVNYLNTKEIEEEHLENDKTLKTILREGTKRFVKSQPHTLQSDTFKSTILTFKIDFLKTVNLYRINRGILVVACVEHLLYPEDEDEEYTRIYRCGPAKATKLYNKLCGFPEDTLQDIDIVNSARSFFDCAKFVAKPECLEKIRSYLKEIEIDSDEMLYIQKASIQLITGIEDIEIVKVPEPKNDNRPRRIIPRKKSVNPACLSVVSKPAKDTPKKGIPPMNKEYFRNKIYADSIINLKDYLINNDIEEEDLDDTMVLKDMIAKAMKRFASSLYTPSYLDTFKRTIVIFTIDFLKAVNLYRVNRGILAVACVEYLLYPKKHVKEYIKVYRCNDTKAKKVYKELCGLPDKAQLDDAIIKSARSFFKCPTFLKKTSCLDKIRSYLRSIVIDDEELQFIRKASIQAITGNEHIDVDELSGNVADPIEVQPPTSPIPLDPVYESEREPLYVDREYFLEKSHANKIILFRRYLISEKIQNEMLEDNQILIDMLREAMKIFTNCTPTFSELDTFKRTILDFTINHLKKVKLYRINRGILTVACVEYLLYPDGYDDEYRDIYRCGLEKATVLYNKLCGYPEDTLQDSHTVESARSFFECEKFLQDKDCLSTVKLYLTLITIDSDEMEFIKETSIQLIDGKAAIDIAKPQINIMDLIEDNLPILMASNQPRLSISDAVPVNFDLEPVVSMQRISHGFPLRYHVGQIVLARKYKSNFWPAKIVEVRDHLMYVKFFPLAGKKSVVAFEEDVKKISAEEINNNTAARSPDLTRECFAISVALAVTELNKEIFC